MVKYHDHGVREMALLYNVNVQLLKMLFKVVMIRYKHVLH